MFKLVRQVGAPGGWGVFFKEGSTPGPKASQRAAKTGFKGFR